MACTTLRAGSSATVQVRLRKDGPAFPISVGASVAVARDVKTKAQRRRISHWHRCKDWGKKRGTLFRKFDRSECPGSIAVPIAEKKRAFAGKWPYCLFLP